MAHKTENSKQRAKWEDEDVLKLLELIKATPALYSIESGSNRHAKIRKLEWEIIGDKMGIDWVKCHYKWKLLKTQWRTYYLQLRSGNRKVIGWKFWEPMSFIRPTAQ